MNQTHPDLHVVTQDGKKVSDPMRKQEAVKAAEKANKLNETAGKQGPITEVKQVLFG